MRKKIFVSIGFVIVLALVGVGFWLYKNKDTVFRGKGLANIQRNLTAEQKRVVEERIQKAEEFLKTLKPEEKNYQQVQANNYEYLGQQYYVLGQMQKSRDMYDKALALVPNDESMLVGLATTLTEAGDLAGARQLLEQALGNNEKDSDIWLRYIDLRQAMGASSQDLDGLYKQALEKTKNYIDVITKYANFQEQQGNVAEAAKLWQEAAKQNPDNPAYQDEVKRLQKAK